MKKITQTIVGITPPSDENVLWLDTTNSSSPVEKVFLNGTWLPTSAAGGDYYTKDEVDENFMGKIDNPNFGNILVTGANGKAVESITKPADFLANAVNEGQDGQVLSLQPSGPTWVNTTQGMTVDNEMSSTSDEPVANRVIKEYVDNNFARQDGWYDTLVSGAAKNLVGHGTTPAEYTFRTSGGNTDIGTGTASMNNLKGNTLVWNQLVQNGDFSNGTTRWSGSFTIENNVASRTPSEQFSYIQTSIDTTIGHKYMFIVDIKSETSDQTSTVGIGNNPTILFGISSPSWQRVYRIFTANTNNIVLYLLRQADQSTYQTLYCKNVQLFDLTLMFGAGNEPSTVAEFEAMYPLSYYPYNAGTLINNTASGIKTTGFNQWDEELESGYYSLENGGKNSSSTLSRNKTPIRVFGATYYYIKCTSPRVLFYKEDGEFISGTNYTNLDGAAFETPSDCRYVNFYSENAAFNNDICINLSWSGYRNGEYEPYEQHTLYFNGESGSLATLTGKLLVDGVPTGESVTIFPDGMKKAGTAYDELTGLENGYFTKAVKRIGSVDLGTINWVYDENYFKTPANSILPLPTAYNGNGICIKYAVKSLAALTISNDKTIGLGEISTYIRDTSYSDVATFKTAMNGVILYYELATPVEYTLDTPVPTNYIVNDFGTEQRIPVDTASTVQAPILYDVAYAMNSVDILRRLGTNFIRKSSMDNILTALVTAGIIGSYTLTYNETDDDYDCSVTAPTPSE